MQQFTIQRFRGGFAVVWYEDGKRKRRGLAARSRTEAEAEVRDVATGLQKEKGGMTVAELWASYTREKAGRPVEESMVQRGKSILPWFGALRPEQITIDDCRQYVADRRRAGRKEGTIWSQMNSLRTCLNWASKSGYISQVPRLALPQKGLPRERYLSRDEIACLLAVESA